MEAAAADEVVVVDDDDDAWEVVVIADTRGESNSHLTSTGTRIREVHKSPSKPQSIPKSSGSSAALLSTWLTGNSSAARGVRGDGAAPASTDVDQTADTAAVDLDRTSSRHPIGGAACSCSASSKVMSPARPASAPASSTNPSYRSVDSPIWCYDPIGHACWVIDRAAMDGKAHEAAASGAHSDAATPPRSAPAPYLHLARAFSHIEPVTGRIRIQNMLHNMFRTLLAASPDDVLPALLLTCNKMGASAVPAAPAATASSSATSASTSSPTKPSFSGAVRPDTPATGDDERDDFGLLEPGSGLTDGDAKHGDGEEADGDGDDEAASDVEADTNAPDTSAKAASSLAGREPKAASSSSGHPVGDDASFGNETVMTIGGSTIAGAICDVFGCKRDRIRTLYKEMGDLGDIAQSVSRAQRLLLPPPPLTIRGVIDAMHSIAAQRGHGSAGRKQAIASKLLRSCRETEVKYLVRTLVQNLRIGVNITTALTSLARAVAFIEAIGDKARAAGDIAELERSDDAGVATRKKRKAGSQAGTVAASSAVSQQRDASTMDGCPADVIAAMDEAAAAAKQCYSECPDVPRLVRALVSGGIERMKDECGVRPGIGIKPMLAKITQGLDDVLSRFAGKRFAAEFKYDGQRAQIHYQRIRSAQGAGEAASSSSSSHRSLVRVFSRHLDDTTSRWPDVVEVVKDMGAAGRAPSHPALDGLLRTAVSEAAAAASVLSEAVDSFVIDCELVAVETSASCSSASQITILPFQTLSTRNRTNVTSASVEVRVCIFAFDLLYLNGRSLTGLPFASRRHLLRCCFPIMDGRYTLAQGLDVIAPLSSEHAHMQQGDGDDVVLEQGDLDELLSADDKAAIEAASRIPIALAAPTSSGAVTQHPASDYTITGSPSHARSALFELLRAALNEKCEGLMCKLLDSVHANVDADRDRSDADSDVEHAALELQPASTSSSASKSTRPSASKKRRMMAETPADAAASACSAAAPSTSNSGPTLVATYQPAVRSNAWLKVKRDYCSDLADSLDLVPIGAWWGNGRKAGWFSPILLACYDPESEQWQSVCRCMSGFTDAFYREITEFYGQQQHQLDPSAASKMYSTHEQPDVWFKPLQVWEIRGADLTVSPVHMAAQGMVHASKGIGMRFPRFIRAREGSDKGPEDATTAAEIAELYSAQSRKT